MTNGYLIDVPVTCTIAIRNVKSEADALRQPRNLPPRCTVERFTHGGRVSEPCGGIDDVVTCSECGDAFCKACRLDHPVCAVAGKPICEACAYPDAAQFESWEN